MLTYEPIWASSHLRLLRLIENPNGTTEWELSNGILLAETEPFIAVSWRWGDDRSNEYVLINGEYHLVQSNLAPLLKVLPSHVLGQDRLPRSFWIDMICINQSDEAEKAMQLALGPAIYSRAACDFLWVGESTLETDAVVRFLSAYTPFQHMSNPRINTRYHIHALSNFFNADPWHRG